MNFRNLHRPALALGVALLASVAACNCGETVKKVQGEVKLDAELAFGDVPVGQTARRAFKVENIGGAQVSLRTFTVEGGVFSGPYEPDGGPRTEVVEVPAGGTKLVEMAYTPTAVSAAGASDQGLVKAITDDEDMPQVSVKLSGRGTQASFKVEPASIDFGDVDSQRDLVLEPWPTKRVTLTNIGSAVARVTAVSTTGLPPTVEVTPVPATLAGPLQPAGTVVLDLTFKASPKDLAAFAGKVVFETDYANQPKLEVPVTGHALATLWQSCTAALWDDGGTALETCVPEPADSTDAGMLTSVDFGSRDPSGAPGRARITLKNLGNLPVNLVGTFTTTPRNNPCPGGPFPSDFQVTTFEGGVPRDGGFASTMLDGGDQLRVEIAYATSFHCAVGGFGDGGPTSDDIVDNLSVLVSKFPSLGSRAALATFQGRTALPAIRPQGFNFIGVRPGDGGVPVDVENAGDRPLTLSAWALVDSAHVPCTAGGNATDCAPLSFAPGTLPVVVPAATRLPDGGSQPGSGRFGTLFISPGTGRIRGGLRITNDDPRRPQAEFPIQVD